jgi:hypothetical protein
MVSTERRMVMLLVPRDRSRPVIHGCQTFLPCPALPCPALPCPAPLHSTPQALPKNLIVYILPLPSSRLLRLLILLPHIRNPQPYQQQSRQSINQSISRVQDQEPPQRPAESPHRYTIEGSLKRQNTTYQEANSASTYPPYLNPSTRACTGTGYIGS